MISESQPRRFMDFSMDNAVQSILGKRPHFSSHRRYDNDNLSSQVTQYAVPMRDVVAIVLCFSTPELGCHDIFAVGSRTTTQHGLEIGVRAGVNSRHGQFVLTTGINGRVDGKASYLEYPPLDSDKALQIETGKVYSVLVILDFNHSVIQYYDLDPALDSPYKFYQSELCTYLNADWLRPLAFARRLEFKENPNALVHWEDKFFFPGCLHQCHQWHLEFPGEISSWKSLHESLLKHQKLAISEPGHTNEGVIAAMKATPLAVGDHCLSMFARVQVPVFFKVQSESIEMIIHGSKATCSGLLDLSVSFPATETEGVLLHIHHAACSGLLTSWSYDRLDGSWYVPCAAASFPLLIGGLIPPDRKGSLEFRASFWKRN
jgi:hypothetical protein